MEIIGIGTDIENVKKFKSLDYKNNKLFYKKIFTDEEINYCLTKTNPYQCFTGKFCAKEAVIKALKKETIFNIREIEILNNNNGMPEIYKHKRKVNAYLSISHCDNYAIAFCLIYK